MLRIDINLDRQELVYTDDAEGTVIRYPVSTGAKGTGEKFGSLCTPRSRHIVRTKIGTGQPLNSLVGIGY